MAHNSPTGIGMYPVYIAFPYSDAWLPNKSRLMACATHQRINPTARPLPDPFPRPSPVHPSPAAATRSHKGIADLLYGPVQTQNPELDDFVGRAGLVQLDVCLDGPHPGEEEDVVLDTPGLPNLAQLSLVWKGGRPDSVLVNSSSFAGTAVELCHVCCRPCER